MWSGHGPASCLNLPALLVLELRSTGNESAVTLPPGRGALCLLPHLHQLTRPWPGLRAPLHPVKPVLGLFPSSHIPPKSILKIHLTLFQNSSPALGPQPPAPRAWPDSGPASGSQKRPCFFLPGFWTLLSTPAPPSLTPSLGSGKGKNH